MVIIRIKSRCTWRLCTKESLSKFWKIIQTLLAKYRQLREKGLLRLKEEGEPEGDENFKEAIHHVSSVLVSSNICLVTIRKLSDAGACACVKVLPCFKNA